MEQSAETERLRAELEAYKAGMEEKMDEHFEMRFNQMIGGVVKSIVTYVSEGQNGPLPSFTLGNTSSSSHASPVGGAPDHIPSPASGNGGAREDSPREMEVRARNPATGSGGAREDSPVVAADTTTHPSPGRPSPLAIIDSLTVINIASQASASLLITSLPPSLTSYMCFAEIGRASCRERVSSPV